MALIDASIWKPKSSQSEFVFAYRYPETNLSTYTQIVVHESQEALLFSKGQFMGKFGPGKHTLDTENLPILRSLFGIPFGGKNPFTAEVWYVNKLMPANLPWKTNRMTIHDVDFNTQMPLIASGQYGLKVVDSERFLKCLVGTKDQFTASDMVSQCEGEFITKAKSAILQFMLTNHVGFKSISAYLDNISTYLKENIQPFWVDYGLELTKFYVSSIDIDIQSEDGRRLQEAINKQSEMQLTGHTWQQEQAYGVANNALNTMGQMSTGEGGLLGSLMAMNMMNNMSQGMGGVGSAMIQPAYGQPSFGGQQQQPVANAQNGNQIPTGQARMIYCANCSKKHSSLERFCPHCGSEYHPCPRCGADNAPTAKRCISCGTPLGGNSSAVGNTSCSHCGAPLTPGASFCPNCGTPTASVASHVCTRCGTPLDPGLKFCPNCGQKC